VCLQAYRVCKEKVAHSQTTGGEKWRTNFFIKYTNDYKWQDGKEIHQRDEQALKLLHFGWLSCSAAFIAFLAAIRSISLSTPLRISFLSFCCWKWTTPTTACEFWSCEANKSVPLLCPSFRRRKENLPQHRSSLHLRLLLASHFSLWMSPCFRSFAISSSVNASPGWQSTMKWFYY